MVLDGIVLGRQAEGVKADREQNVVALHPALAADDVHRRKRARVADVQALAGGIRKLDQTIKLHSIHFSLKNQKIISRSRGGAMVRPGWFLLVL